MTTLRERIKWRAKQYGKGNNPSIIDEIESKAFYEGAMYGFRLACRVLVSFGWMDSTHWSMRLRSKLNEKEEGKENE